MVDLKTLAEAIIKGDQNTAVKITKQALNEGIAAKSVLKDGLIAGMDIVGARFKNNEIFVPEVLIAARAMKSAMGILEPELAKAGVKPTGTFLIGTVQGVTPEKFVEQVKASNVRLVGMSALLTTTMPGIEKTIKALKNAGISAKIMIGGAPITQAYADKIGADGYAPDAASAVDVAKCLI